MAVHQEGMTGVRAADATPEVSIEARALSKRYKSTSAVQSASFDVGRGEIFGLLGPNGAGKTTTIKILTTLIKPTSGEARIAGFDVVQDAYEVRRRIGLVFQEPTLDERLTGRENLLFHARLYRVPAGEAAARAGQLLEMVELADRQNDPVKRFSGGMRRRLEIARGLLHRPDVLFLDEPTIGLDPQTRERIWDYVRSLRDREGTTVLMTTHYMDEAEHCDRIAVMDQGELVALDTPAALKGMMGGDVLMIATDDPDGLAGAVQAEFQLKVPPKVANGHVVVEHPNGAAFVPKVASAFPDRVSAIEFRRPSLEDVFLRLTGRALRDAGSGDRPSVERRGGRSRRRDQDGARASSDGRDS